MPIEITWKFIRNVNIWMNIVDLSVKYHNQHPNLTHPTYFLYLDISYLWNLKFPRKMRKSNQSTMHATATYSMSGMYRGIILRYCHRYAAFSRWRVFLNTSLRNYRTQSPRPRRRSSVYQTEVRGKDLKELEEVCPNERASKQASERAISSVYVCV